jgi:hypothetical protein
MPWEDTPKTKLLDDPMRQSTGRRKLEPVLPAWADLLNERENGQLENWALRNGDSAYSVSLENGEFLVLAERQGYEFVLQRLDPPSDRLYYLESHDGRPEPLSERLELAIKDRGQQAPAHGRRDRRR